MLAEFAAYRSWIDWVLLGAPFVAVTLIFRRVRIARFAMVGTSVGFVAAIAFDPLGRDAEMLGPNMAFGLVGGLVAGALCGALSWLIAGGPRPAGDGSVLPIGLAIVGGSLGAIVGGAAPTILEGRLPDLEVPTLIVAEVGGGLGWCAGVAAGWYLSRDEDPIGRTQGWIVFTAAATVTLLGAVIAASVKAGQFGPSIDSPTRHERAQLPLAAALAYADTALAVATFIVVALRPGRRQPRATGTDRPPGRPTGAIRSDRADRSHRP